MRTALALVLSLIPLTAAAAPCALKPGRHTLELDVAGQRREALVLVGPEVGEAAPPVLFAWHGFGGSPDNLIPALSPQSHWKDGLLVLPQGLGRSFKQFGEVVRDGWQVVRGELGDRDLMLFDALVERLGKDGCLDRARVYSTGFSNGGFFSNLLACHRAAALAAVAPVGGGGPFSPRCDGRVPVRIAHGSKDGVVPYKRAQESVKVWAQQNGCSAPPPSGAPGCTALARCGKPVELCTFDGGHTWPRDQTADLYTFLRAHRR